MKEFDILVMGELNVDLILSDIQSFPEMGKEILAKGMNLTLGSSSAIFASNAAAFGQRVAYLGKIGVDVFGHMVISALKEKKVNTSWIVQSKDLATGATVALSYGNERAMVTHTGAMEMLSSRDLTEDMLDRARHLHISSVFLQPLVKQELYEILRRAKDKGLSTSVDTQWDPSEKWDLNLPRLLPLIDVFIPNEDEVKALTQTSSVEDAILKLKDHANIIVVKRGSEGSTAYDRGEFIYAEPFPNHDVVDAIGAGDSFDAGFISQYLRSPNIELCLKLGNLAGALNTTAPGGTAAFASPMKIKETAMQKFQVNINEFVSL